MSNDPDALTVPELSDTNFSWDLYIAGSLRNPAIPELAEDIRADIGCRVFDQWYAAGPQADDHWQEYWQSRCISYRDALKEANSQMVFNFDKRNMDASKVMVLVAPSGKSAHLELGYMIGKGRVGIYYFPEETDIRWDVMLAFATEVCIGKAELYNALLKHI